MRRIRLLLAVACLLALLLPSAMAGELLTTISQASGDSLLEYPQLTSLPNSFVQDSVNQAIKEAVAPHENTFLVLQAGAEGSLRVTSRYHVLSAADSHDLLSLLITAQGRMPTGRPGFEYLPLMFDLANGQPITAAEVFADPAATQAWLEEEADARLGENLSVYLDLQALRPLPLERLLVHPAGISFYYPEGTFTWLSGRSASLHYLFHEIQPLLNLEEGSLLHSLGVNTLLTPGGQTAVLLEETVTSGCLPGLDACLGEPVEDAVARLKLLHDPEGHPEGQQYQMEDDSFRGSLLLSSDGQTVDGILSRRMNLFGLITGQANRETAQAALGQPFASLPLPASAAQLYGLEEGQMDAYLYEGHELRLYYDTNDLLYAVWLKQQ